MTEDSIVQEVRAVREAFAAAHGYDIRAMVETLREQAAASGREVVRLTPRTVDTVVRKATVDESPDSAQTPTAPSINP